MRGSAGAEGFQSQVKWAGLKIHILRRDPVAKAFVGSKGAAQKRIAERA